MESLLKETNSTISTISTRWKKKNAFSNSLFKSILPPYRKRKKRIHIHHFCHERETGRFIGGEWVQFENTKMKDARRHPIPINNEYKIIQMDLNQHFRSIWFISETDIYITVPLFKNSTRPISVWNGKWSGILYCCERYMAHSTLRSISSTIFSYLMTANDTVTSIFFYGSQRLIVCSICYL